MKDCKARIDSFYHGSAVDGAGLRCVLFFSGCNLRCPFCHNPETLYGGGREITVDEAERTIGRYRGYLDGGGVTLSGGEPFLQAEFCIELTKRVHNMGLNVIAETNGLIADRKLIEVLDGVRLDVKNQSGESEETLTDRYAQFLSLCKDLGKDVLLTNVLVPSVNDGEKAIERLGKLKRAFPFCRGVKFLPFKKLCLKKYEDLKISYPYADKNEATAADVKRATELFEKML